jgi:hypothetical protein
LGASGALAGLEEDVNRLARENESLRNKNLELEMRLFNNSMNTNNNNNNENIHTQSTSTSTSNDVVLELGRKLKSLQREGSARRQETASLKSALRERNTELQHIRKQIVNIEDNNIKIQRERSRMLAQIAALKQRIKYLEGQMSINSITTTKNTTGTNVVTAKQSDMKLQSQVPWGTGSATSHNSDDIITKQKSYENHSDTDRQRQAPIVLSPNHKGASLLKARVKDIVRRKKTLGDDVVSTRLSESLDSSSQTLIKMPGVNATNASHDDDIWIAQDQTRSVEWVYRDNEGIQPSSDHHVDTQSYMRDSTRSLHSVESVVTRDTLPEYSPSRNKIEYDDLNDKDTIGNNTDNATTGSGFISLSQAMSPTVPALMPLMELIHGVGRNDFLPESQGASDLIRPSPSRSPKSLPRSPLSLAPVSAPAHHSSLATLPQAIQTAHENATATMTEPSDELTRKDTESDGRGVSASKHALPPPFPFEAKAELFPSKYD